MNSFRKTYNIKKADEKVSLHKTALKNPALIFHVEHQIVKEEGEKTCFSNAKLLQTLFSC